MLPVQTVSNYTPPTTLVATALPGTIAAAHVAVDSIPPSVSNTQVENNSRANGAVILQAPVSDLNVSQGTTPAPTPPSGNPLFTANTAPFIAQLLGQNSGFSQIPDVFAQYEKLVHFGIVKYMPSNPPLPELRTQGDAEVQHLQQQQQQVSAANAQSTANAQTRDVSQNAVNVGAPIVQAPQIKVPVRTTTRSASNDNDAQQALVRISTSAYRGAVLRNTAVESGQFANIA